MLRSHVALQYCVEYKSARHGPKKSKFRIVTNKLHLAQTIYVVLRHVFIVNRESFVNNAHGMATLFNTTKSYIIYI